MTSDVSAFKAFCKGLWILNWSKWILAVDIPTQISITILLSVDSNCKLKVYIKAHTKEKQSTTKMILFANLVSQWK